MMGFKDVIKQPLVRKFHKVYERNVEASLDTFEAFLKRQKTLVRNVWDSMTETDKLAIDKVSEELLFIQVTPGKLSDEAKRVFARYFFEYPEAVLAYCDEFWEENDEIKTSLKPDWSPDTYVNRFYFDGLVVVRKCEFEKNVPGWKTIQDKRLWWQVFYDFIKVKGGFNKRRSDINPVVHVPYVLYQREESEVNEHFFVRRGNVEKETCVILKENPKKNAGVAVIIPSKDHPELLEKCISSLKKTLEYLRIQIIVVDNGSRDDNKAKIESLAATMNFQYIYRKMPFNFSKMCNIGAAEAKEEQLLFLNDDIECIHAGWLEDMCEVASRPHVGAVGSKLLYPDGKRIQHAGITNLSIGPVHKLQFLDDEVTYYDETNRGVRNVLAVTGACLLIRREVYEEVGGMTEDLAVAFNDVELCFKLYEMGYYQAVLLDKPLYHHESLSRGDDESTKKWKRLMAERTKLYSMHPGLEGIDPFYNSSLNRTGLDVHILPEYMQGKQQRVEVIPGLMSGGLPAEAREDNCLMVRAEICRELIDDSNRIELYGYGVVLGSDNSLFSKEILLRKEDGTIYNIPLKGQYRADLIRNMPDQINVAMSGFWLIFEKADLPSGSYEVGMYAADKTSRTKLYCFTSKIVEI